MEAVGMRAAGGWKVAVTGAAGFIGRAVVDRIEAGALGPLARLRLNDLQPFERANAEVIAGSYADASVRDRLVEGGIDILFHLASLPGGAAERQPALGKAVNLDGSLALLDALAASPAQAQSGPANATAALAAAPTGATTTAPVVVYASSIAALGIGSQPVNDMTALRPAGSYGTHKAMIELYLADLTRRGWLDGRSVRPAGIVARPRPAYAGFATAWMSELFHAALDRRELEIPVRAGAHVWLQSIDKVADNIIHAASMPAAGLPAQRAWTLPASVVRIDTLVDALQRRTGQTLRVEYGQAANDQPPLDAGSALALGFVGDGDTESLVDAVMSRLELA